MKTPVYQIHTDQEQLTAIFDKTGDISRNFLNGIGELATTSHAPQPELLQLQPEGKGALAALEEFQLRFGDSLVASTGPRYWGFVTGGATPAAIMAWRYLGQDRSGSHIALPRSAEPPPHFFRGLRYRGHHV